MVKCSDIDTHLMLGRIGFKGAQLGDGVPITDDYIYATYADFPPKVVRAKLRRLCDRGYLYPLSNTLTSKSQGIIGAESVSDHRRMLRYPPDGVRRHKIRNEWIWEA